MDGRICVKPDLGELANFSINRSEITVVDTVEVLRRLLQVLTLYEAGLVRIPNLSVDSLEVIPRALMADDEPSKICIVWNAETHQIRAALNGVDLWQACQVLNHAYLYLVGLYIRSFEGEIRV